MWHGDRLIAGTKRGYFSASLRSGGETVKICDLGADTPLLAVGSDGPCPVARHVPQSADTALLVDDLAVFVDPTGAPSVRRREPAPRLLSFFSAERYTSHRTAMIPNAHTSIPTPTHAQGAPVSFKARPKLIVHSPPFVCAWVEEQTALTIFSRASGALVQVLAVPPLASAAARVADAPGVSADNSDDGLCVLACGRKIVVVRRETILPAPHPVKSSATPPPPRLRPLRAPPWRHRPQPPPARPQVAPMPLEKQAQRLLRQGLVDEALAVAEEAASCAPGGEFSEARVIPFSSIGRSLPGPPATASPASARRAWEVIIAASVSASRPPGALGGHAPRRGWFRLDGRPRVRPRGGALSARPRGFPSVSPLLSTWC